MGLCAGAGIFAGPGKALAQAVKQSGMNMPGSGMQGASAPTSASHAITFPPPVKLASYVTPLAIPPVIRPKPGAGPIEIHIRPFHHRAHRDLPATPLWGYNGVWPGPTFEVTKGQPVAVKWINQLPTKHFLPLDFTIHGEEQNVPEVRTVTRERRLSRCLGHVRRPRRRGSGGGPQSLPERSDGYHALVSRPFDRRH
jgi:spore coat protein A, manganese oxidase